MTKLEYTLKTDLLFKTLFIQYPDLLKQLVSELLQIPYESIEQFIVINPEMPAESLGDKFCRLDINMTVNGQLVDLEIQVENEKNYPERVLFHWAREYASALPAGKDYKDLPRTIIISIIYLLFISLYSAVLIITPNSSLLKLHAMNLLQIKCPCIFLN